MGDYFALLYDYYIIITGVVVRVRIPVVLVISEFHNGRPVSAVILVLYYYYYYISIYIGQSNKV